TFAGMSRNNNCAPGGTQIAGTRAECRGRKSQSFITAQILDESFSLLASHSRKSAADAKPKDPVSNLYRRRSSPSSASLLRMEQGERSHIYSSTGFLSARFSRPRT